MDFDNGAVQCREDFDRLLITGRAGGGLSMCRRTSEHSCVPNSGWRAGSGIEDSSKIGTFLKMAKSSFDVAQAKTVPDWP